MEPNTEATKSIKQYCDFHNKNFAEIMSQVKYDCICHYWYFVDNGLFVGVEKDGYLHT